LYFEIIYSGVEVVPESAKILIKTAELPPEQVKRRGFF
jgi:hypothetical protein